MSRPIEELKFAVEEWTADDAHVSEVLARVSNISIALAALQRRRGSVRGHG